MLERKEETRIVKEALTRAGYTDVRATHGRGTGWGWLTVEVSVPMPGACTCDKSNPHRYPYYCNTCRETRQEASTKATEIILLETGRRRGEYDGNTIVDINLIKAAPEPAPTPTPAEQTPPAIIGPPPRARSINDSTLAVLSVATVEGNTVILNSRQLERPEYIAVNKVLEAMGGKWNRKAGGHVFDSSPADKLEDIILTGEYDRPADYGYYPTPASLIDTMIEEANLSEGLTVLEPSAGQGAILEKVAPIVGADNVDCYELIPENAAHLGENLIECCDFLTVEPEPEYDRVIMNPPFARQQDIDHVTHALKFLKPGGRLVSIMSSGITFRQNRKALEFTELLNNPIINSPAESFKLSGTVINTVMVVIDKPGQN